MPMKIFMTKQFRDRMTLTEIISQIILYESIYQTNDVFETTTHKNQMTIATVHKNIL